MKLPRLRGPSEPQMPDEGVAGGGASSGGKRSQAVQRLQVGLSGLAAMILLVGLANIIQDRARVADEMAVPEAASTIAPAAPPPLSDPLADAGVVPDLPAEPSPSQSAAIVPEQGNGSGRSTP
ncbi:hypothetical protein [Altererythrobacter sp. Z27]|uniref:hypothetical protein n=1 Tax=Altererythrobacter sp. Z27 TaxID=3461147 RepID=UPI0040443EC5